jgi:hypothetical protein
MDDRKGLLAGMVFITSMMLGAVWAVFVCALMLL